MAAAWGMAPITTGLAGLRAVRETAASWVQARHRLGKSIDGLELGVQCLTCVADSDAAARKQIAHPRWQNRAGRALNRLAVEHGKVIAGPYEGEPGEDTFWERLYYGSPDTVREKFQRLAENGATFASTWMMLGEIKHESVMKSIKLMGEHVIPALKDARPPADLPAQLLGAEAEPELLRAIPPAPSD
jgi:alkanesulfonate monooxygenase SsuD/methylene tetrahydromethanopterin reductase-like flavin-dependent oxidoreductase (luciferase family)